MDDIKGDPELGLEATFAVVPDLAANQDQQRQVLVATIETWSSPHTDATGAGAIDLAGWAASLEFMRGLPGANIPADLAVDDLVTEELLP
jgi:hypothetical protein